MKQFMKSLNNKISKRLKGIYRIDDLYIKVNQLEDRLVDLERQNKAIIAENEVLHQSIKTALDDHARISELYDLVFEQLKK